MRVRDIEFVQQLNNAERGCDAYQADVDTSKASVGIPRSTAQCMAVQVNAETERRKAHSTAEKERDLHQAGLQLHTVDRIDLQEIYGKSPRRTKVRPSSNAITTAQMAPAQTTEAGE